MKTFFKYLIAICLLLTVIIPSAFSDSKDVKVAFLRVDNINRDPRYDYLSGMISGILLFDLSSTEGITIIDRRALDDVLKEQELSLGDLSTKDQIRVGQLLGAKQLLTAGFVFLGDEVMVNLTLVNVETSKSIVLSRRGRTENTIHALSEDLVVHLTGQELTFQSKATERSIISMKDEKPGSIELYCYIIDAEIILDGEFAGYTTGNGTVPFKIENLKPGNHNIKILYSGFGEVKLPEITFHDWERTIDIQPGKNHVVRAESHSFTRTLQDMANLALKSISLYKESKPTFSEVLANSFSDRKGNPIETELKYTAVLKDGVLTLDIELTYNGKKTTLALSAKTNEKKEEVLNIGITELKYEIQYVSESNGRYVLRYQRTDIDSQEWRNK